MSAFRLFIVDDEPAYTELLAYALDEHEGLTIDVFHTGADAVAALDRAPHLVLLDVVMPGQDGLVTLEQIKAHHPDLPVIMISSQASVQVALDAIRRGATDYLTKGQDDLLRVSGLVHRVRQEVLLRQEVDQLRARMQAPQTLTRLLGDSPAMGRTIQIILKVVRGDLSVVIFGESGTGKELVAQAIHDNSPRRTHPFVAINCAAIPRDLMESAFLGHVKGAFTG
ncbi:MAG: sigma 54-interacting transcriptional regulator, partial [Bacteroidota bacterium]